MLPVTGKDKAAVTNIDPLKRRPLAHRSSSLAISPFVSPWQIIQIVKRHKTVEDTFSMREGSKYRFHCRTDTCV